MRFLQNRRLSTPKCKPAVLSFNKKSGMLSFSSKLLFAVLFAENYSHFKMKTISTRIILYLSLTIVKVKTTVYSYTTK